MGMKQVKLTVTGSLSVYNSPQDARDRQAWEAFVADVRALAAQADYPDVVVDIEVADD